MYSFVLQPCVRGAVRSGVPQDAASSRRRVVAASELDAEALARKVDDIMTRLESERRATRVQVSDRHVVLGTPMDADFASMGYEMALFGMGCFWGPEKLFWQAPGVHSTSVGYTGGALENPTYKEVCSGSTGHAEVVRVVYDPKVTSYRNMLDLFWSNHETTTPNRQGPDVGTQYRSVAYWYTPEQEKLLKQTRDMYQKQLHEQDLGDIVTELGEAPKYFFAEDYHQQYLAKNPWATCNTTGPGVYEP
eukprot:CAMPEP_0198729652 /NCGR_PEP_ID=MMETSP1475-20131203/20340_1 /TAXON_ID= ORGANISM="Unidentified sp., Strain CCMP1999" /NCGR_SAMPLE_ID=MMETSP1475 /ASSEMBLY_ACC=CAM_ASM_001111 /LENGTH=247 /DNA_ID=CAMNT_0044492345 /DNA_START=110 /DNA_END=849 /DNA_ORIENTATION=-